MSDNEIIEKITENLNDMLNLEDTTCPLKKQVDENEIIDEIREKSLKEIGITDNEITNIINEQHIQKGGECDESSKATAKIIITMIASLLWYIIYKIIIEKNKTQPNSDQPKPDSFIPKWVDPGDANNYENSPKNVLWFNGIRLLWCLKGKIGSIVQNIITSPKVLVQKIFLLITTIYNQYGNSITNITQEAFNSALVEMNKVEVSNFLSPYTQKYSGTGVIEVLMAGLIDIICELLKISYSPDIENHAVNATGYGNYTGYGGKKSRKYKKSRKSKKSRKGKKSRKYKKSRKNRK
jgi:hypothetical protein